MDSADEEETIKQRKMAAALRRREEHVAWKRAFFQARPPPPPIGQLHRRQQGRTKGHSCRAAFLRAVEMHMHFDKATESSDAGTVGGSPPASSGPTSSAITAEPAVLSKQEAWAAQLHGEKERRNPATDLNVRSDPTRTVIMANLHPETVEEDLRHFADQFGRVVSVRIVRHHTTGKSRRYAFVEFGLAGEARRALQFHRKKRLKGHAVIIDREKGRTEPRFLPKRMATAEPYFAVQVASKGAVAAADGRAGAEGLIAAPANGSACEGEGMGPVESPALSKGVTPALPEDDDDFLNSLLNS